MSRVSRCRDCGALFDVETTTGPLPSRCSVCDPEGDERRSKARTSSTTVRQRERIAELEQRLAGANALIERQGGRRRHVHDPGRRTLTRCVRRVAYAEGREGTVAALLDLRDAAEAWAAMLAAREPVDDDAAPTPGPEPEVPTVVRTELGDVETGPAPLELSGTARAAAASVRAERRREAAAA